MILLLLLLVGSSVVTQCLVLPECSRSIRELNDDFGGNRSSSWNFEVRGQLEIPGKSPFSFNESAPSFFTLTLWKTHEIEHEVFNVVGRVFLRARSDIIVGKNWKPRVRAGWRKHRSRPINPRSLQGDLKGVINTTSGDICLKTCINRYALQSRSHMYTRQPEKWLQPFVDCEAFLSIKYPPVRTIDNQTLAGRLQSVRAESEPNYFSPISLTGTFNGKYSYTQLKEACPQQQKNGLANPTGMMRRFDTSFMVTWDSDCSERKCHPFGSVLKSKHSRMYFRKMIYEADGRRVNGFLVLDEYNPVLNAMQSNVIAVEGKMNENEICMVGCSRNSNSSSSSSVMDCSIRITLQASRILDLHHRSSLVGYVHSQKQTHDPLYFSPFTMHAKVFGNSNTYSFSKIQQAKSICSLHHNGTKEAAVGDYPDGVSFRDMWATVTERKTQYRKTERASFIPLVLDGKFENYRRYNFFGVHEGKEKEIVGLRNVSFDIVGSAESMSAEGVYDSSTGRLCMIGCRSINNNNNKTVDGFKDLEKGEDCKIQVHVQYPPYNSLTHEISATISSFRTKDDPLYFEPRILAGHHDMYSSVASQSIWLKNLEILLSVLTLSLVLIALIFQIFHTRRHPESRPYTSLVMLGVLTCGHMIPLVLNFEAVFSSSSQNNIWSPSSNLAVNEVMIRVMSMGAFLVLLWLIHRVWTHRKKEEEEEGNKIEEHRVGWVCGMVYIIGNVVGVLRSEGWWKGFKSSAGVMLDLFLIPQIVAYIVWGNKMKKVKAGALSNTFYIGMTLARIIPHVYDVYRKWRPYNMKKNDDYVYFADEEWDFFSLFWDISIPSFAVLLAFIVFLQQSYGGRCLIPHFLR